MIPRRDYCDPTEIRYGPIRKLSIRYENSYGIYEINLGVMKQFFNTLYRTHRFWDYIDNITNRHMDGSG